MKHVFETDYEAILLKIEEIDPIKYGHSRNYIDGAVTYLSPYISRGVISTKQVLESVIRKGYQLEQIESFVKELCWRDYFQRVGQERDLNEDIKQAQQEVSNYSISKAIVNATTGILGIDNAVEELYESGYMHNHFRMYTASLVCNVAKSNWRLPSKWMYYHLLDGDFASNNCSWQWVAGANSNKKYYANQENINKYARTNQVNTFLDIPYEDLPQIKSPAELVETIEINLETILPIEQELSVNVNLPSYIYNYYNLDPLWHQHEEGNRILLLEPSFFTTYPVSEKCMKFMLDLALNIPNIQVFIGSFDSLKKKYQLENFVFKEHPLNIGYEGIEEQRDWICEELKGYYPSFFAYWKKVEKVLTKQKLKHANR
jgi:deoxyribodipyrimidine photo-lyase